MSNKWEVTGSLDIDHEFMARVLDDCDNKNGWLVHLVDGILKKH